MKQKTITPRSLNKSRLSVLCVVIIVYFKNGDKTISLAYKRAKRDKIANVIGYSLQFSPFNTELQITDSDAILT
jgi:hypothetical protein